MAFNPPTPQSHKEGVGNLQCPVPRRNGLIAGTKPTKERIDPVNGLVLEAPHQRGRCVQHEAGHQRFPLSLIRSFILSPPRVRFLRNSIMSAMASDALLLRVPVKPLRREF